MTHGDGVGRRGEGALRGWLGLRIDRHGEDEPDVS
jgi:hypothetical protein